LNSNELLAYKKREKEEKGKINKKDISASRSSSDDYFWHKKETKEKDEQKIERTSQRRGSVSECC